MYKMAKTPKDDAQCTAKITVGIVLNCKGEKKVFNDIISNKAPRHHLACCQYVVYFITHYLHYFPERALFQSSPVQIRQVALVWKEKLRTKCALSF